MKVKPLPPLEYLNANLWYDFRTGFLWWKKSGNKRAMNKPAGTVNNRGYVVVGMCGKIYLAHRVCWSLYNQRLALETEIVDHKRGKENGNGIDNLLLSTSSGNNINIRLGRNTSGHRGVVWKQRSKAWEARIGVNGKRIHLGSFDRIEDAIDARLAYEKEHNIFHRDNT